MPPKINVCVLLDAFDHMSGVRTTYNSMLNLAPDTSVNLTLIAPSPRSDTFKILSPVEGARLVRVPSRFSFKLPGNSGVRIDWPPLRAIRRVLEDINPDILHTVSPGTMGMYGTRFASQLKLPLAGYYHTDYLSMQKPEVLISVFPNRVIAVLASGIAQIVTRITERMTYGPCDVVLCEAGKIVDKVKARKLNPAPVLVPATLRHDLDPTAGHPDGPDAAGRAFRERMGLREDQHVIFFVGRLAPDKNIEMIGTVAERCPDAILMVAGEGPLKHLVEGRDNVVLLGLLDAATLWAAYAAADLLLMPSWNETFGLVSLEAMAMGLPVLTADTAGSAPVVLDAGAGMSFSPHDPDECVRLLRELLADRARLDEMQANAREWAAHNRPIDRYRRFIDAAYRPLL